MCLYPKLIKNRKYTENKKNGGKVPAVTDPRTLYVPIGCGKCIECMKKKAREWQVRLLEEIKPNITGKFITLTFSNESIQKIIKQCETKNTGYALDNEIATKATRLFLERWRKQYKKSLRHWFVTELGHNGTENIHLHGIVWTTESYATIAQIWSYGFIWPRPDRYIQPTFVSEITVNYITKYVHKIDHDHKTYKPIILTSPGIGAEYTNSYNASLNKYNSAETLEYYKTKSGHKISLPIYYRNKIYTDEEKEKLWLNKLDQNERWICGEKIKADNTEEYYKLLEWYRKKSTQLGYGDDTKNWELEMYENNRRELLLLQRLENEHGYPASWDT